MGQIEWTILSEQTLECLAFKQLHHDVDTTIARFAKVSDAHSIGVTQAACSFCFAAEPGSRRFIFNQARIQDLYCNDSINKQMPGAVDGSHPAYSEFSFEQVFVIQSATEQGIYRRRRKVSACCMQRRGILRT